MNAELMADGDEQAEVLPFPLTKCAICRKVMYGDPLYPAYCGMDHAMMGQPEHTAQGLRTGSSRDV